MRPQSQNSGPTKPIRRYDGPIFLPPQNYKLLSHDAMKALKAYSTEAISRFHQRKVHNTEIVETPQDDPPGPPVPENDLPDLPESNLDIPDDPILDFVNSQCHSSEDLDQALQAYQAYQVPCPQDSTMTPERSINHHFTYHIAQASQAKHGSLLVTEFRQPLQVQSHLEMPRILVQLGHTQRTQKLAPQTDPKWSPTWSLIRF